MLLNTFLDYIAKFKAYKIGYFSFNIGIFLLFSAPFPASCFLLLSLLISVFLIRENIFNDKINIFLLIISVLMILSCSIFQFNSQGEYLEYKSELGTHPFIGLVNWIPLFFSYVGFQNYLRTKKDRITCSLSLIFGTLPILISGFGQYLFNWYGPFELLNGLIIWYQRENTSGMTSLFNNPNYAACALATTLPFFYANFFKNKNLNYEKLINAIIIFLVVIGIFFTSSRNGLLSFFVGTFIFFIPLRSRLFSFSFISIAAFFLFNSLVDYLFNFTFIPLNLANRISFQELSNDPRLLIWKNSITYIFQKPFLGWGGNSFASLWNKENTLYFGHSHSIPLEISIQYGLITSSLLSILVFYLLVKSFKVIFLDSNFKLIKFGKDNFFDRGWFSACFVILFSNTIDILYFDIRISVLTWLFLAGLRNISKEIYE